MIYTFLGSIKYFPFYPVLMNCNFRTPVATQEHVEEAFRLFNVSTMDAARSGINEHLNLTPEIANEIKVKRKLYLSGAPFFLLYFPPFSVVS